MGSQVFPKFSDGNVEIHFSATDDTFILHSWVLSLHSSWFKASLSERWNTGDATLLNGKNHWVYELRFDKDSEIGMLMRRSSTDAASTTDTDFIQGSKEVFPKGTHQAVKELQARRMKWLRAHQDMLRILYHVSAAFNHSSSEAAKSSILQLAKAADMYGCEAVAKLPIESHLRLYRTEVLELCVKDPIDMLQLAKTVKSEWIFMEAATNILGRSKDFYDKAQPKLVELQIAELLNKKRSEFTEKLQSVEFALFRMQPTSTDVCYAVTAVSFFRQWLSEKLEEGKGSSLGPGYALAYHTIASKNFSFSVASQKKSALDFMVTLFSNGAEMVGELESFLEAVFATAADTIQPILKDITRRQHKTKDVHPSLLFMGVNDDELPWVTK